MSNQYRYNVRVDLGGVTFTGPGMDSKSEAEAIKQMVEHDNPQVRAEVFQQ